METATETVTVDAAERLLSLLHPIFRHCLDPDMARYDLSTPWIVGDFVYATDARILVRSPVTPELFAAYFIGEAKRPDVSSLWGPYEKQPLVLPSVESVALCEICKGRGKQGPYQCSECGHTHVMEEDCPACLGFGRGEGMTEGIDVGDYSLSHAFSLLLVKYQAVLFRPVDRGPLDKPNPLRFTIGDNVEGWVMPRSFSA